MIEVRQPYIPFGRFDCLTIYCFLFIKGAIEISDRDRNHEGTHCRQQFELLAVALVVGGAVISSLDLSWWLILLAIPFPFVCYGLSWLIEWLLPPYNRAYGTMCFETEAYYNEHKGLYSKKWWRHLFAWVKFIKNEKYPYPAPYRKYDPYME